MEENFSLQLISLQKMQAEKELVECNEITIRYGICLTDNQINNLVNRRFAALKETGRIEFGEGILKMLVEAFCDSPFINQDNYEETLSELQDSFYYFKNECEDKIADDELISFMKEHFDGICKGSVDYLSSTTLEELCRNTRYGFKHDNTDIYGSEF